MAVLLSGQALPPENALLAVEGEGVDGLLRQWW
jgi:hypothetical protein